jgi:hypothetical protein
MRPETTTPAPLGGCLRAPAPEEAGPGAATAAGAERAAGPQHGTAAERDPVGPLDRDELAVLGDREAVRRAGQLHFLRDRAEPGQQPLGRAGRVGGADGGAGLLLRVRLGRAERAAPQVRGRPAVRRRGQLAVDEGDDRVGQQVLLGQLPTSQVGHAESS